MKPMFIPMFAALTATALTAAAQEAPPPAPAGPGGGHPTNGHHMNGPRRGADHLFISPMGEPFRGDAGRSALIAAWFAGADANHDGKVNLTEFRADAARFFAMLDTNRDGEIDPDELTHYEEEIAPEIRTGGYAGGGGHRGGGGMPGGGHGGGGGPGGGGGHHGGGHRGGGAESGGGSGGGDSAYEGGQGAGRFGMLDIPEPVASADSDFNRGVSEPEFLHAATERFLALDLDHHGQLTLAELPQHPPKVEHHQAVAAPDSGE